jgi:2-polyprenyl-3-methyl-5-hydroxy-6-metoxy-1,4-benzoquinol methylase
MKTKNKKLMNKEENRKYYSESDKNYMDEAMCTHAHKMLDRVAWLREKVHDIDSRCHLDIGCKDGYTCLTLQSEGVDCIGVDPSQDAIDVAKDRALRLKIPTTFTVGYVEDIEENFVADSVSMLEVLEHVVDPEKVIQKLCKLGRMIMVSTPDAEGRHGVKDAERNQEHLRVYTKQELEELISKYGNILESVKRDDQLCIMFKPK